MRRYRAGRFVWSIVYAIGAMSLALGLVTAVFALVVSMGEADGKEDAQALFIAMCSGGGALCGLMLMAMSDLVLAVVDTAENTQAMLSIMSEYASRKPSAPSGPLPPAR